jgi:CBS domain-containing protein
MSASTKLTGQQSPSIGAIRRVRDRSPRDPLVVEVRTVQTLERTGFGRQDANGRSHRVAVGRCSCGCPYLYAVDDLRLVWRRGDWESEDQRHDHCINRACACHDSTITEARPNEMQEDTPRSGGTPAGGRQTRARVPNGALGAVRNAMATDVVAISAEDHLGSATRTLERAGVNGAPVVRDGRVVGVVSMRELRSVLPPNVAVATTGPFHRWEQYLDEASAGVRVHEVMYGRGVSTTPETSLADAARMLIRNDMTLLPVVDAQGSPVGILCRQDVVEAVAAL